jgi:hypothetical protein
MFSLLLNLNSFLLTKKCFDSVLIKHFHLFQQLKNSLFKKKSKKVDLPTFSVFVLFFSSRMFCPYSVTIKKSFRDIFSKI